MKNKKAGLPDGFFLIVALFTIALIFVFMFVILSNVNDSFQSSSAITSEGKSLSSSLVGKYANLFDKMFLFITIGLGLAVVAGAWFIRSHPALFWISVPILAFTVWMGMLFANMYYEISHHDQIKAYADDFLFTTFIFEHFGIVMTGFVLLLALALYAKKGEPA